MSMVITDFEISLMTVQNDLLTAKADRKIVQLDLLRVAVVFLLFYFHFNSAYF